MEKTRLKQPKKAKSPKASVDHYVSTHPAANDTLYSELELRYGGAFAQWIVDGLPPQP
jgi:hypothetical protein